MEIPARQRQIERWKMNIEITVDEVIVGSEHCPRALFEKMSEMFPDDERLYNYPRLDIVLIILLEEIEKLRGAK